MCKERFVRANRAWGQTSGCTFRFDARSFLFPASAITTLGIPCRCSSRTQFLARLKDSLQNKTIRASIVPGTVGFGKQMEGNKLQNNGAPVESRGRDLTVFVMS